MNVLFHQSTHFLSLLPFSSADETSFPPRAKGVVELTVAEKKNFFARMFVKRVKLFRRVFTLHSLVPALKTFVFRFCRRLFVRLDLPHLYPACNGSSFRCVYLSETLFNFSSRTACIPLGGSGTAARRARGGAMHKTLFNCR